MKSFKVNQKSVFDILLLSFLVTIVSLLVISCGGGGGAREKLNVDQINEIKEGVITEINSLKAEIQQRMDYIEEEIENADGELGNQLDEFHVELEEQGELLDEAFKNVQDATLEEWNYVVENASETVSQVTVRTTEISEEVRTLLEN